MNSASPFTAHQDVLEAAIPADSIGQTILINELKNRAKAAVLAQQWPHASALYRKAVEIVEAQQSSSSSASGSGESNNQEGNSNNTNHANELAILESNLSLVHGKMHQWDAALIAAERAVQVDVKYVKGWWRLGQAQAALENYDAAVKALQEGKKRDPSNKALIKELDKLKVQAADAAAKRVQEAAETAAQDKAPSSSSIPAASAPKVTSTTTSAKTTTTTTTTSTKSTANTTTISSDTEKMQIDDDGFSKSEVFKGYKIVNGKKTSYFHNELSKEAAELIGDIAPKKIDVTSTTAASSTAVSAAPGASAWNQAGTWEEKDVTTWAQDSLQTKLLAVTYTLPMSSPAPAAMVRVTKATATGHASVAVARGKKRYIYEWLVKLDWEFQHGDKTAKGHIAFPDVDGTCMVGEPYEAHDFAVTEADDEHLRPILEAFVHKQGLRDELHKAIDEWVGLFKELY